MEQQQPADREPQPVNGGAGTRVWRNFCLLLAGNLVSVLGSSVYLIVIVLYLKDETGSAAMLGLYNFMALLPPVVLGPFAGALVDRWSRRNVLVVSDAVRGALMLLLAGFALLPSGIQLAHILVITAVAGVAHAFFLPAVQTIVPEIVPASRLKRAHSLRAGGSQISNVCGNALGGVVYVAFGLVPVLIANGVSFLLSAVQESWIRYPHAAAVLRSNAGRDRGRVVAETAAGLRYITRRRGLRAMLVANSAVFLLSPPLLLVLPFVVEDVLQLPTAWVGFYFAAMLVGGIMAYTVWAVVPLGGRGDRRVLVGSFFCLSTAVLVSGLWLEPAVLLATFFVCGAAIASVNLVIVTSVQRLVPHNRRARVFSLIESAGALSAPFAYAFSGLLIDLLLQDIALIFFISAAVVLTIAVIMLRSTGLRRLLD